MLSAEGFQPTLSKLVEVLRKLPLLADHLELEDSGTIRAPGGVDEEIPIHGTADLRDPERGRSWRP